MNFYVGQIFLAGFTFNPQNSALCDGQILPISSNEALFSLLGTTFGGNGFTDFALPDLRGRAPIHKGQGPGLTNRKLGQKGGAVEHTLNVAELPSHDHAPKLKGFDGNSSSPDLTDNVLATPNFNSYLAHNPNPTPTNPDPTPDTRLHPESIKSHSMGRGQSHYNMQPYQVVSYCITLNGIMP